MTRYQKNAVLGLIFILLALAVATIYYLAKSNLWFYATGVFWTGAITGFASCLFLSSLISAISLKAARGILARDYGYAFPILIVLSGLLTAAFWFSKPGDSDVWWYGAMAGSLVCLPLVLVALSFILFRVVDVVKNP